MYERELKDFFEAAKQRTLTKGIRSKFLYCGICKTFRYSDQLCSSLNGLCHENIAVSGQLCAKVITL